MNATVTANVLPCDMGNAGFWRYENYFPTAMGSSFPHGRAPGFALTAACECMETQAKSFAVDGAKCHHLRHGFAQCWEIMEGALRCQGCHHPLPLSQPGLFQRSFPYHTVHSSGWLFWRFSIKLPINVMPSSVSRSSDGFWVSSTIRWTGKMKR